jgi:trimeric autotransporter adhesin
VYVLIVSVGCRLKQFALLLSFLLVTTSVSRAQTASLTLSSASASAGSIVTLNLFLTSGSAGNPAGLQWTFSYLSAGVTSFLVTPDLALISAGKTITCAGGAAAYTCLATGINSNVIPDGNVAVVRVVLAPTSTSLPIAVAGALGASPEGYAIPVAATGGSITIVAPPVVPPVAPPPTLTSVVCAPNSLSSGGTSICTVNLSAPTNAAVAVGLSSSVPAFVVPASVTIPLNASSATFAATAGALSADQTAVLIASLNGTSTTTSVSLLAPGMVSSLACNPSTLGPNSSTTCTVSLTKAAPTGGAIVTLSDNNLALTVPASVTVPAAAASATFSATTAGIASDQSATITASYNGSFVTAGINLAASAFVSSLACNPSSVGPNSFTTCTVSLTKAAPSGGAIVTLSDNSPALTVLASVTVPAAAASATFNATTAATASDQSATITATYNGTAAIATVNLAASAFVSSLACNPSSLGPNSSSTCTVSLTKAAPSGGAIVTLSGDSFALTVPSSVTVPAAATSATFSATTAAIASDQSATVTATYNGTAAIATVNLAASAFVSSLACNPSSLGPNSSSTCTVTLTKTAPGGGVTILVSTTNGLLSAPSSAFIAAGSSSAAFTLQAGSFTANQSGSVTASYNASSQSVTVPLIAALVITSLTCNPSGAMFGTTPMCTATLSRPASTDTTVTLSSASQLITVPANIVITAGNVAGAFPVIIGSISTDTTASIAATLGTSSQTATLTLWSTPLLDSFTTALSKVAPGTGFTCTVTISKAAGDIVVSLSSNNDNLTVPATVTIPQGSISTVFTANVQPSASGWIVLTATLNGFSKSMLLTISSGTAPNSSAPASLNSMSCTPKLLTAGSHGICHITLAHGDDSTTTNVQLSSSSPSLRLPEQLTTRPGQSSVEFQVDAVSSAQAIVVDANLGSDVVQDTLAIAPDPIQVPGPQFVKYGTELRFQVSAADPTATLSADPLPPGAYLDSSTGEFRWTPDGSQLGPNLLNFSAIDSAGVKASASVTVQVDSGDPIVTGIVNAASRSRDAACSPGSIATIDGRWLTTGAAASDSSGGSMTLAGVTVWANGLTVPILSASDSQLNILCPDSAPGMELQFVVETDHGIAANPLQTIAQSATPGIFSLDGSGAGQGWVVLEGTDNLAMLPNYLVSAQPAIPGERLLLYVTGLGNLVNVSVQLGAVQVTPGAITPVPDHPGLYQVNVSMPVRGVQTGVIPISLSGDSPDGTRRTTNTVSIAVAAN